MTDQQKKPENIDQKRIAKYTMSVTVNLTGVQAHNIRKFEEAGLCNPSRTESKQRLYSDQDIDLIKEIGSLLRKGINLAGIKVILSMKVAGSRGHESNANKLKGEN